MIRENNAIPTSELIRMSDFVLKNNYFKLNGQIKQQISGTAIGTKFSPPYARLFMDKIEIAFLETQEFETHSFWCGLDVLTVFFFYLDTW